MEFVLELKLPIKKAFLYVVKFIGVLRLARIMTRGGLRILCYHGFSKIDESQFRPETFMEPSTFQDHIGLIISKGYSVISLPDALKLLHKRLLPPCSVVITFDDGFKTIQQYALPVLQQYRFPCTIFLTTYYCIKENPVFRLVVQYMFWKTANQEVDLTGMGPPFFGRISLLPNSSRDNIIWQIINYAETELLENDRQRLAMELGVRLGVPYENIFEREALSIMKTQDIYSIAKASEIDIQLHTHRHNFPEDRNAAIHEIEDNRAVLEPILKRRLTHFCYPSGIWSENHFQILKESHIESAVTCDPGLNYANTPRYALRRFLDGQHISNIQFEAELSGFMEIMRRLRNKLRPQPKKSV